MDIFWNHTMYISKSYYTFTRALKKVRKKIKNYAENFGSIMQKNVLIMGKKHLDNAEI